MVELKEKGTCTFFRLLSVWRLHEMNVSPEIKTHAMMKSKAAGIDLTEGKMKEAFVALRCF